MIIKGKKTIDRPVRRLLCIQLGDIGDVVLSLPSVRALKDRWPQAKITMVVREKAEALVRDIPQITDTVGIGKFNGRWGPALSYYHKLFVSMRRARYDLAVDLRTGTRGAVLAFMSRAERRIGFYTDNEACWRNRLFTDLARLQGEPDQHISQYYLSLLRAYHIDTDHREPEISISSAAEEKARLLLKDAAVPLDIPVIAVGPFSLWPYKEWGIGKYNDLIQRIRSGFNLPVVIVGSLNEKNRAGDLTRAADAGVFNLAGKTSIADLAAVLHLCGLFIGGDSAGIHIAAAVGTPTIGIFGPAATYAWAPRGINHRVVQKEMSCMPCNRKGCEGSGVSRCLEDLSVEDVFSVVKGRIQELFFSSLYEV